VHRYSNPENLRAEREHIAWDLKNVEKGIRDVEALAASRQITRDYAEAVLAQCREEHKRLCDRLMLLDASLHARR
jgi:hypothetical protein